MMLEVLSGGYAVCRLPAGSPWPAWAEGGPFVSITRTAEELSVVCAAHLVPPGVQAAGGWRALKVAGPLDFSLVGILAALSGTLAAAGVSIFALSTYDTDYLLVPGGQLSAALDALRDSGHTV